MLLNSGLQYCVIVKDKNLLVVPRFFSSVAENRNTESCKYIVCVEYTDEYLGDIRHHIIPAYMRSPERRAGNITGHNS